MMPAKGAVAGRALTAVMALGIFPGPARAVTVPDDYSIASVESDLRQADKIGSLKSGLVCLPKGKLLWRDIAKPSDAAAIGIVSHRLSGLGLAVADVPDPVFAEAAPMTRYRIKVTYESLTMMLCVAGFGIGRKPSGTGTVIVRWDIFDRITKAKVDTQRFEVPLSINGRDARSDASVVGDALRISAGRYVLAGHGQEKLTLP